MCNRAIVVGQAARTAVIDLHSIAIGAEPEAPPAILQDRTDIVGRILIALEIGVGDEAEDRAGWIRLAQAHGAAADPEQA